MDRDSMKGLICSRGCGTQMIAGAVFVPAIHEVVASGKPLAAQAICRRCAVKARRNGKKVFTFLETEREISRRRAAARVRREEDFRRAGSAPLGPILAAAMAATA